MKRQRFSGFMIFILGLAVLGFSGCSKKSEPVTAAESTSTDEELSQPEIEDTAPITDDSSSNILSNLPTIYFDFDQASISSQGRTLLKEVADSVQTSVGPTITIEGHCDERGSNEYNLALGERRARSVKDYLQRLGIPETKLSTISYGEERPADMGSDESAWAKNRRAELLTNN